MEPGGIWPAMPATESSGTDSNGGIKATGVPSNKGPLIWDFRKVTVKPGRQILQDGQFTTCLAWITASLISFRFPVNVLDALPTHRV